MRLWRFVAATLAALVLQAASGSASAEIAKTARLNCQGICLNFWPVIAVPEGWHTIQGINEENNVFAVFPDNDDAAYIYAKAWTQSRDDETLADFIDTDLATTREQVPDLTYSLTMPLTNARGEVMPTYRISLNGDFEIASYTEEKDAEGNHYFVLFVLNADTEALRETYQPVFESVVKSYK